MYVYKLTFVEVDLANDGTEICETHPRGYYVSEDLAKCRVANLLNDCDDRWVEKDEISRFYVWKWGIKSDYYEIEAIRIIENL